MAEDFNPGFFLDVATEAKLRFDVVDRDSARFLTQGLDFKNRKSMSRLQYDFVELAIQPLDGVDFKDAFDTHRPRYRRVSLRRAFASGTALVAL